MSRIVLLSNPAVKDKLFIAFLSYPTIKSVSELLFYLLGYLGVLASSALQSVTMNHLIHISKPSRSNSLFCTWRKDYSLIQYGTHRMMNYQLLKIIKVEKYFKIRLSSQVMQSTK